MLSFNFNTIIKKIKQFEMSNDLNLLKYSSHFFDEFSSKKYLYMNQSIYEPLSMI